VLWCVKDAISCKEQHSKGSARGLYEEQPPGEEEMLGAEKASTRGRSRKGKKGNHWVRKKTNASAAAPFRERREGRGGARDRTRSVLDEKKSSAEDVDEHKDGIRRGEEALVSCKKKKQGREQRSVEQCAQDFHLRTRHSEGGKRIGFQNSRIKKRKPLGSNKLGLFISN